MIPYFQNNLSFDNTFDMKSSIDMLSSVSAYLKVKKVNEHVTTVNTDLALVTFLQHMKVRTFYFMALLYWTRYGY